ncbi:ATP-dependent DNA helicase [Pseudomarimonas salicorniae]|uniref:DNA 5'-3' helicase n=1 Tax=Pseudomarimonas salicorniae TaxID=2933270 RepID=A0ABT0GIR0_9GAMM|nr:ATP-dependent DNA helicase [Lysobacter sp. CAU 1642]MCK7593880.1 ATP-dependent DNA helicase [Lysobacter sp. CAU 1642]
MTDLPARCAEALQDDGALARAIPGFRPRPAQVRMAEAVAEAMTAREALIAEAGTGTGKTYGYLVPALLSGLRVIVSTGTKALQDQLYERDLPRVRKALGVPVKTALLKGRANYLCWHRLEQARNEGRFASREIASQLVEIHRWAGSSARGDIAELEGIPEDSPLWPQVTSTTENCLGAECPFFDDCFVVRARRAAQEADLVVVNHHLLLADMALRQEGFGEILPGAHAFVLDEAHQVPELASQFFSVSVSVRQLQELARDALSECANVTGALAELQLPVRALEQGLREARLAVDALPPRGAIARFFEAPGVAEHIDSLIDQLADLNRQLELLEERSPGFKALAERGADLHERLDDLRGEGKAGEVRWYEITARGFTLSQTPLDVAAPLRAFRERSGAAWIFTSATLSVNKQFHHYAIQLGLFEPRTLLEPSPFDYPSQALAYLPKGLVEPSHPEFVERLLDRALPVLRASRGRAFLLFTSHRALRVAAERLEALGEFPLYVQGSQPRTRLLEEFRASGNGVLLGAASFWEGVDVAGDALCVVVIDKLPFAAPDDPVLEARLDALRQRGGQPFRDWQLPSAVIALKQGAGRLIRTHADRGVLLLGDTRLVTKPYGRLFIDSLPPFARTREESEVLAFLEAMALQAVDEPIGEELP